jgi:hypothetical protein
MTVPEPIRRKSAGLDLPVTDYRVIEMLQGLEPWRAVGDSVDWEIAVFAYDVPAGVDIDGIPVRPGLYTREVTGDGRTVTAHRWTDHDALVERLDQVEHRHVLFEHIAHAAPGFVAEHADAIHTYADRLLALIEGDEAAGRPLHDAVIRCWFDVGRYLDPRPYVEDLSRPAEIADYLDDEFVTAVSDRTDTLLHQRDRVLTFDEADAAGLDATLRDGRAPHTWGSLTPRQRAAAGLNPDTETGQAKPHHH